MLKNWLDDFLKDLLRRMNPLLFLFYFLCFSSFEDVSAKDLSLLVCLLQLPWQINFYKWLFAYHRCHLRQLFQFIWTNIGAKKITFFFVFPGFLVSCSTLTIELELLNPYRRSFDKVCSIFFEYFLHIYDPWTEQVLSKRKEWEFIPRSEASLSRRLRNREI